MIAKTAILVSSLAAMALAAPTRADFSKRSTCSPNFQGTNINAINVQDGQAWQLSGPVQPEVVVVSAQSGGSPFRFEFSGQDNQSYLIKVGGEPSNRYALSPINNELVVELTEDASQNWVVQCDSCADPSTPFQSGTLIGSNCNVADLKSGKAVRDMGDALALQTLDPHDNTFYFNLVAAY